jgi:hypothetical protein
MAMLVSQLVKMLYAPRTGKALKTQAMLVTEFTEWIILSQQ